MTFNTLFAILVLLAGALTLWGLHWFWRQELITRYLSPTAIIVLRGSSRIVVTIVTGIIALRLFGINSETVFATFSALILVIAVGFFAVWSVLSNLLCAVLLLLYGPFRIGDEIELLEPGKEFWIRGKVIDINMFFVTLVEAHKDGSESINRIPNNLIMQKVVRRWPGQRTRSLAQAMNESGRSSKAAPVVANPETDNDAGVDS